MATPCMTDVSEALRTGTLELRYEARAERHIFGGPATFANAEKRRERAIAIAADALAEMRPVRGNGLVTARTGPLPYTGKVIRAEMFHSADGKKTYLTLRLAR